MSWLVQTPVSTTYATRLTRPGTYTKGTQFDMSLQPQAAVAIYAPRISQEALVRPLAVIGLTSNHLDSTVTAAKGGIFSYKELVPLDKQKPNITVRLSRH